MLKWDLKSNATYAATLKVSVEENSLAQGIGRGLEFFYGHTENIENWDLQRIRWKILLSLSA